MPFGQNTGNKFSGNDGIIKAIEYANGSETPLAISHVAGFTAEVSAADVELSELGASHSDGDVGQKTWVVTADIWKGKAGAFLIPGLFQCEFVLEDNGTDGKIVGKFRLLTVGVEKKLNQGTAFKGCRFVSCGTVTVTDPSA